MKLQSLVKKAAALSLVAATALTMNVFADALDTYTSAYRNVMTYASFDADITATFTMDGEEKVASGNFKVDASGASPILYLEASIDDETFTQFSDGKYLYTDAKGSKSKYPLGVKAEQEDSDREEPEEEGHEEDEGDKEPPTFDSTEFLSELASCLEVGKIRELGIFDPIPKEYVVDTTVDGNTYTLDILDLVVEQVSGVIASTISGEVDGLEISDFSDFSYVCEIEGDYVTSITYGGSMEVTVPASISGSEADETYDLDLSIKAEFNNPGQKLTIELPSTDGY